MDNRIVRAIREMGFEKLSPIQEQAIPYLLQGEDIIGQAQTGTGKTAAFGIPAIQHINPDVKKLQTIILCPTRELAIQAAEELRKIAKYMHGIKVLPVYGGQDISRQIAGLRGVQIIVGTPGRVMDHMRRRTIKLDLVNMVVLDEADEMLNMGFREDMELILGQIPGEHQTALFSATMPKPILEITDRFQNDAKLVKVAAQELTIPLVSQKFYRVKNQDKDAACVRLLEYYQPKLTLIFCNTKKKVDELSDLLKEQGFQAEGLHGDLSQAQRDAVMKRFRNGGTSILIATDVAARGIDVDDVFVQLFRMFEICKFHHHVAHGLAAAHHHPRQRKRFGAYGLHVVIINADKNVLYFVGELINALAEQGDVLALDRRDKSFYQRIRQQMLLFICRMFHSVYLLQLLGKLGRVEMLHCLFQQMGRLARKLRAGNEIFKIERILFF